MSEAVAAAAGGCVAREFVGVIQRGTKVNYLSGKSILQCQSLRKFSFKRHPYGPYVRLKIKSQTVNSHNSSSTYSSNMFTDIPLYETSGASFDQYLEDKPRVFKAIFPDKRRSQRLNEEEWRVHMLPIQFFFLTVLPVIDMRLRCRSNGTDYPPGVPANISKVLELDIIRWDLQGLESVAKPTHFSLGVKGALYPDRRGVRSRLKGQLEMKLNAILPPMFALVPEDVIRNVLESVLKRLVENMKDKVNGSLLDDYSKFRRERQMKPV